MSERSLFWVVAACLTLLPLCLFAEEPQGPSEEALFEKHLAHQAAIEIEIGLRLFDEGDDYRAITALKRYRLLAGTNEADHLSHLMIAEIYRRNAYTDLALRHFWDAARAGGELSAYHSLSSYHLGIQEICASMRAYTGCHPMLDELEAAFLETGRADSAELVRFHRQFTEFVLGWSTEAQAFDDPRLQRASLELASREQVFADLPLKHPALAGVLSALIPGAGQAYNGRWLDAGLAFGFTALFASGAAYSYLGLESVPLTVVTGLLTLGFYSGNIANAVVDARRHNAAVYDDFFEGLHEDLWPRAYFRVRQGQVEYDYDFDWPGLIEEAAEPEAPAIPGLL